MPLWVLLVLAGVVLSVLGFTGLGHLAEWAGLGLVVVGLAVSVRRWLRRYREPLDGPRYISWNFVSSSKERLKQAAEDWRKQRFARVPEETAYIPLPEDGSAPVDYP